MACSDQLLGGMAISGEKDKKHFMADSVLGVGKVNRGSSLLFFCNLLFRSGNIYNLKINQAHSEFQENLFSV